MALGIGRSGAALLASGLLAALIGIAAAGADEESNEGRLSFHGKLSRTIDFEGERQADLKVVLRNDSDESGSVGLEFLTTEGQAITFTPDAPEKAGRLTLTSTSPLPAVPPHAVKPLTVRFMLPAGSAEEAFTGLLVAKVGDLSPALLTIAPKGATVPQAKFEPESVTFVKTVHAWVGSGGGTTEVAVSNGASLVSGEDGVIVQGVLSSDDGRSATVKVTAAKGTKDRVRLKVEGEPDDGEYRGKVQLPVPPGTDEEKASELSATLQVQHWWVWPLLVLLAGALAGQFLPKLVDAYRRTTIMRCELMDAYEAYDEQAKAPSGAPHNPWPEDQLGEPRKGKRKWPRWPLLARKSATRPNKEYIGAAKSFGLDEIDDAKTEMDGLIAAANGWVAVDQALADLRAAYEAPLFEPPAEPEAGRSKEEEDPKDEKDPMAGDVLQGKPPAAVREEHAQPYEEARYLFNANWSPTAHARSVDELVEVIQGQVTVLQVYRLAYVAWKKTSAADATDDRTPPEIYASYPAPYERRPRQYARLVEELGWAYGRLVSAPREITLGMRRITAAPAELVGLAIQDVTSGLLRRATAPRVTTPEEIRAGLRKLDWWMWGLATAVAVLAFFLPYYTGKSFGSADDYGLAFAAGFIGTLVINWDQLPVFRSYKKADAGEVAPAKGE